MPNWVENEITITGDKTVLSQIKEQLARKVFYFTNHSTYEDTGRVDLQPINDNPFSFYNIVSPLVDGREPDDFDWYNWNLANWGVKWDSHQALLANETDNELFYTFSTAWSDPDIVLVTLSKLFPDVEIVNRWTEEQGFGEENLYENGTRTVLDKWDIPEYTEEEEDEI